MGISHKIGNENGKEWEWIAWEWEGVGIWKAIPAVISNMDHIVASECDCAIVFIASYRAVAQCVSRAWAEWKTERSGLKRQTSGAEWWAGVGKKLMERSSESERDVAERQRSGERAESVADCRSSLLSTVQSTLCSLQFSSVIKLVRRYRLYRHQPSQTSPFVTSLVLLLSTQKLPRDARSAKRGIAIVSRPSVRLSVSNADAPWA